MKKGFLLMLPMLLFSSLAPVCAQNVLIPLWRTVRPQPQPTNPTPPINPLDEGNGPTVLFSAELQAGELVLTALDAAYDVEITVTKADAVVYSSTESFVGMDEEITIITSGWSSGTYTISIVYGDVMLIGSFVLDE